MNTLLKALQDKDACVRLAAAQVLAKRDNPDFVPNFFKLLGDQNFEIRLATVQYLGRFRHPQITKALAMLLSDSDSDVRLAAAKNLGASNDKAAVEALVTALVDEERAIRQAAERALNQIDPDWTHSEAAHQAALRLQTSMDSRPAWVRSAISQVLARLGVSAEKLQIAE